MKSQFVVLLTFLGGFVVSATADEPRRDWHHSFTAADREAQSAGLPLLLHFYADWCGPCRQMEHRVLNSPEVLKLLGVVVVGAKINVDREPGIAQRFGVPSYPFDVLVSPDGDVLFQAGGYVVPETYVARTGTAAANFKPRMTIATSTRRPSTDAALGLDGYCPVSILRDQKWRKGNADLACEYQKMVYHFASEDELILFQENPKRYAPQFRGLDPVLLSAQNRREEGNVRFGLFYRDRLYLFTSLETRDHFIVSPDSFTDPHAFAVMSGRSPLQE